MKICEGNRYSSHDQIVHDERECPLCKALDKIDELGAEIDQLKEELHGNRS